MCVFASATGGIGAGVLERMAAILREPTLYVLGRSSARFASQKTELENLNSGCKVIFIQVEISLLAEVDAACQQTLAAEKWVDCLYMSPGLIPFNGQECMLFLSKVTVKKTTDGLTSTSHQRGPGDMLRALILLSDAPHIESTATSFPVTAAKNSQSAQRRQRKVYD